MRAVFIGAGSLAVITARLLLKRGQEVVIIEKNKDTIEALTADLDCGFLLGDGSKPAILSEADPAKTDVLFCLTGNDQDNIIASLVGRSLGFARIVTKIEDPEFEHICIELGLDDTIIPGRTIGRYLADMLEGQDPLQLSTMIREEARIYSLVVREEDAVPLHDLKLPKPARVVCLYRAGKLIIPDGSTELKADDEAVVITNRKNLPDLQEIWGLQGG